MADRRLAVLVAVLALAACSDQNPDDGTAEAGQQLEQAAAERGLFGGDWAEPAGIFERRSGDGRDRMCVTSLSGQDASGGDAASGDTADGDTADGEGAWRFAMEIKAKDGGSCLTGGTLRVAEQGSEKNKPKNNGETRSADEVLALRQWSLRFQGLDNCTLTAAEQGDQLILPAHLPASCAALCAGRVDLAGAELDRTSWSQDEAAILRLRRADGRMESACAPREKS
jgi:hypothetical protein